MLSLEGLSFLVIALLTFYYGIRSRLFWQTSLSTRYHKNIYPNCIHWYKVSLLIFTASEVNNIAIIKLFSVELIGLSQPIFRHFPYEQKIKTNHAHQDYPLLWFSQYMQLYPGEIPVLSGLHVVIVITQQLNENSRVGFLKMITMLTLKCRPIRILDYWVYFKHHRPPLAALMFLSTTVYSTNESYLYPVNIKQPIKKYMSLATW